MKNAFGFAAAAALVLVAGQANAAVWMTKAKGIFEAPAKKTTVDDKEPVRNGTIKAKIIKHTFVQKDDGTFEVVTSDVCTKESKYPVYDVRDDSNTGSTVPVVIECDTMLGGKEATVNIGAMGNIVRDTPIDETFDFKGYGIFLNASRKDGGSAGDTFAYQVSGTKEIGSSSTIAYLQPNVSYSCSSSATPVPQDPVEGHAKRTKAAKSDCTVSVNEYFSATIDMQD